MMRSDRCVNCVKPTGPSRNGLRLVLLAMLAWGIAGPSIGQVPEDIFHDGFEPPPPAPVNDTCASATGLTLDNSVNGTTVGANNDYNSGLETCTGYSQAGPDVAYSMFLAASQSITVTLSAPDAIFDPSISLIGPGLPSCNAVPVTCLKGADFGNFGVGESFQYTAASSGTYYIIVDSFYGAGSAGDFTIKVSSP